MKITREDITCAKECLEDLDDYARMANINPIGAYSFLTEFIKKVEQQIIIDNLINGE